MADHMARLATGVIAVMSGVIMTIMTVTVARALATIMPMVEAITIAMTGRIR
jgi:hypothetical protein